MSFLDIFETQVPVLNKKFFILVSLTNSWRYLFFYLYNIVTYTFINFSYRRFYIKFHANTKSIISRKMNITKFRLPISLSIILILLVVGGYLILSPPEIENSKENMPENRNNLELEENDSIVEPIEKEAKKIYNIFVKKLEKNANVPFRVGQKFEYEFTGSEGGKDTYVVEKIERIDGEDNYVIHAETKGIIIISPEGISTFRAVTVYYYNNSIPEST